MRCLLLAVTDNRARTDVSWGGVVQESSKGGSGGGCRFEGSSEGRRDGGQGPSLSLEDGTSEDGRAKRHLDVSSAEGEEGEHGLWLSLSWIQRYLIKGYRFTGSTAVGG
jgi:hypothetical protein